MNSMRHLPSLMRSIGDAFRDRLRQERGVWNQNSTGLRHPKNEPDEKNHAPQSPGRRPSTACSNSSMQPSCQGWRETKTRGLSHFRYALAWCVARCAPYVTSVWLAKFVTARLNSPRNQTVHGYGIETNLRRHFPENSYVLHRTPWIFYQSHYTVA